MTLCGLVILSFLQVSCSTGRNIEDSNKQDISVEEERGSIITSKVQDAIENKMYLGGVHMETGIECNGCHIEESEDNEVSTAVCISCHTGFAYISAPSESGLIDPHNAHRLFSECGDCHHAHMPSKDQCLSRHSFNSQIP